MSELITLNTSQTTPNADHLVVFCDKSGQILGELDQDLAVRAAQLIKQANFEGNLGEQVSTYGDTILSVVGVGELNKLADNIAKTAKTAYNACKKSDSAAICWGNVICHKHFGQFVTAFMAADYRFDDYKKESKSPKLSAVTFVNNKDGEDYETALAFASAVIEAQNLARDVANEPPNVCTPEFMAQMAQELGEEHSDVLKVTILDEEQMDELGMGCFLSVAQGSQNEGKLAVIEYFGKSNKADGLKDPIALVGKGITFDTGGISIKPSSGMDEMKFDMGGSAAMLGVAHGLCVSRLGVDVVIVLALAENMPSGHASRPGDIVQAMDGTTVEILNTDAEGRLVLADALCYVQENYTPSAIVDAATLTGACVVALGDVHSGLYANDEDILFAFENASERSGDTVWHLPLGDGYKAQLKSPFADLQNIGSTRGGGSITAACFLQHFIKNDTPWVHLDIAGTASISGEHKGATGRPVPLLMHYLKTCA